MTIAPTKIHIATHWSRSSFLPRSVADSPYTYWRPSGSAISAWKSGFWSRSLPRNQLKMPIISTPKSVDGIVIDSSAPRQRASIAFSDFSRSLPAAFSFAASSGGSGVSE